MLPVLVQTLTRSGRANLLTIVLGVGMAFYLAIEPTWGAVVYQRSSSSRSLTWRCSLSSWRSLIWISARHSRGSALATDKR